MAATVKKRITPNMRWVAADITLDASYPTGGYALTPADFGLSVVELVVAPHTGGYDFEWDPAAFKLKAYRVGASFSNPQAEVTAAVSLSTVTVRAYALGW